MELDAVIRELERVRRECATKDWDGYNADPVREESYSSAMQFAQLLPSAVPSPEVYATPDGDVCFEWYETKNKVFTVGVGDRKCYYAGLFGTEKFYGKADFQEGIPDEILNSIKRFYT